METCNKCKSQIAENEKFCSICGARKGKLPNIKNKPITGNIGILEGLRQAFRELIVILIVLILIVFSFFGSIISDDTLIGLFGGFLTGGIIVILFGGLIATIIEMGDNLRYLREEAEKRNNQ